MKRPIALCVLIPLAALANPGPATQYLMNEPASLMDVGMLRVELLLDQLAEAESAGAAKTSGQKPSISTQAVYDFVNDIIVLQWSVAESEDPRSLCESVLRNPVFGKRQFKVVGADEFIDFELDEYVASLFMHSGYTRAGQPEDLTRKILERVEIRCSGNNVEARKRLLEEEIYWSEIGEK